VADEECDSPDGMLDLLGEGQCLADKARQALPQRVVEALDVVGFPCVLRDRFVALRWNDTAVYLILIRMEYGVLLIDRRDLTPQDFGTRAAPIAHVKRDNLTRGGVHGQPDPLLVGLLLHKAPHFVGFGFEFVHPYCGWMSGEPQMSMVGAAGEAFHHEVQQPRQADAHRAANPAQGEALT